MDRFKRIVLHIPHASDRLPEGCNWSGNIRMALDRWTDWHTDTLFGSSRNGVECFVYQWSRFYCDIERLTNDPMESIGPIVLFCIVYTSIYPHIVLFSIPYFYQFARLIVKFV